MRRDLALAGATLLLTACDAALHLVTTPDDRPDHRCGVAAAGAQCGQNRFCTPFGWCHDAKEAAYNLYDGGPDELIEKVDSLPCVTAGATTWTGGFQVHPSHYQRSFQVIPKPGSSALSCYEDQLEPLLWESLVMSESGPSGTAYIRLNVRMTR